MKELAKPRLLTLVANPQSGGGRAGRNLPRVASRLREALPTTEISVVRSTSWEDADVQLRAAAQAARDGDTVIAMGGDGMAHLGLNACAHSEAQFGIIPSGTGNDFARALGIPTDIPEAVEVIAAGKPLRIDLAKVQNERGVQYVGAAVSTGYDAIVNRATNEARMPLGALSYGYVALRELRNLEPMRYRISIDGVERSLEAIAIVVCNTSTFGGGLRIAPDADPTDGVLDLTIIHPASTGKLLRLLPALYTGKLANHANIERISATRVTVDGDDMFAMGDGEELGGVPVEIESDPGALEVFVP